MKYTVDESIGELLHHETYRPEELAKLLSMAEDVIRHAVHAGELPATVVGHDILEIARPDVLRWLKLRSRT